MSEGVALYPLIAMWFGEMDWPLIPEEWMVEHESRDIWSVTTRSLSGLTFVIEPCRDETEICGHFCMEKFWKCNLLPGHDCLHMPLDKESERLYGLTIIRSIARK